MTRSLFPDRLGAVLLGVLTLGIASCGEQAGAHTAGLQAARVATTPPMSGLTATMRPEDGVIAGVGMPVILRFSAAVAPAHRRELTDHIRVTSVPPAVGAWHWFAADEVHWRPASFWAPGTRVAVTADLDGVLAGPGLVGQGTWWKTFTIGARHVSIVDTVAHRMRVFDGDRLIATWPLSAGRSDLPTISGTLYVRYKNQDVLMDSTSIGIPNEQWDGYYEHVFWNTAISTDGYYVHAAPWSLASQGVTNVSHGCVNLSTEHAMAFYNLSHVGDVVIVRGSKLPATGEDGEGDWQMSFEQFAGRGTAVRTLS
ncbi:MAG TPA: L,D-transpeptidase [Candidatus Dormibacteraeota bacterium]|jgi:lipoprotein-anchoring transpeptidase ErfK/SrfK|nr:L,D-transpeptidase [Candidatus Dormibacteraeota bacterium]